MTDKTAVLYDIPVEGVARLTLNRPEARNAQDLNMLQTLDDQFTRAMRDESVRVIILAAAGPDFSSGHDMRKLLSDEPAEQFGNRSSVGDFDAPAYAGYMAREEEVFFQMSRRWRNLAKPTIAQVQGRCIAGGLILAWVCDLIVASEDATFVDPVSAWGVPGLEWFGYPWEFGARKAKEFLFTGDTWTAEEAWRLGMVNHVVPAEKLAEITEGIARRVAAKPAFALKAAKQAVNAALDAQGQGVAMDMAFQIHHLSHFHNLARYGWLADTGVMPKMKK